jgi:hypothetical protein
MIDVIRALFARHRWLSVALFIMALPATLIWDTVLGWSIGHALGLW